MFSIILAFVIVLISWKIRKEFKQSPLKNFSKTSVPLLRNSFNLAFCKPEELFLFSRNCAVVLKKSYQHHFFTRFSYNIIKAEDAEKVLGSSKHIDKSFIYTLLHPFLKTGLLTSNGEKWQTRRRMLTPAFHFDILKEFYEVFREESDKLVESLHLDVGKALDIVSVSSQSTLNTICESAMGVKLSELGNDGIAYRNNLYEVGRLMMFRLMRPWIYLDFFFALFGYRKQLDEVLKPVLSLTKSIFKDRKQKFESEISSSDAADHSETSDNVYFGTRKRRYAMMDTLLQAQRNGLIDDEGIIEETDTFTFEGHDTTSAAMTFTLLLLAHHPEAQERIFEDIQEVLQDSGRDELTIDDFNRMDYLDRVIKESLRLYPPVFFISRVFSEDFYHDGITHRKGTTFHIHIMDIHRDPEVFPDPEKFDPDRFLPENSVNRSNFSLIAFSAGKRNCIGQRFAMLELKMMLTKLVRNFRISPMTKRDEVIFISDIVLRSKNPIQMKFFARKR